MIEEHISLSYWIVIFIILSNSPVAFSRRAYKSGYLEVMIQIQRKDARDADTSLPIVQEWYYHIVINGERTTASTISGTIIKPLTTLSIL